MSEARRAKYYTRTDDIPERLKTSRYIFNKTKAGKTLLYDTVEKEFVVKNSRSIGTPGYQSIAGG